MALFVARLPRDCRERDIEELFYKFGDITRCELKGSGAFAFIDYKDDRDAEDAIRKLDGSEWNGSRIAVEWAKSSGRAPASAGSRSTACYFCGREGHFARDCPDKNGGGRGGGGDRYGGGGGRGGGGGGDRYGGGGGGGSSSDRYGGRDSGRDSGRERERERRRSPSPRRRSPSPRRRSPSPRRRSGSPPARRRSRSPPSGGNGGPSTSTARADSRSPPPRQARRDRSGSPAPPAPRRSASPDARSAPASPRDD